MLSPYTGKEMKVVREERTWHFRGEDYKYIHTSYLCEESGEQFTTCESDDDGYNQVVSQYITKYGLPSRDEIKSIRKQYGVSASKMSLVLGLGANQWRLYEMGEVPSLSNGRLIRCIKNPVVFLDLLESSRGQLTEKEYNAIYRKVSAFVVSLS